MPDLNLSQRHILLVDDEVFSRDTVAHIIRSIGQPTLYQAGDGIEALELLREHDNIDLVICDFKMPKMNGLGLLKAIRRGEAPVPRATMFAMLTGYSEKPLVHAALALDVNAFLIKPVSKKMLIDRFQRMFTVSGDAEWVKPAAAYEGVDTHIPSIDPSAPRESVFDKIAEQEFATARLAQALNRKKAAQKPPAAGQPGAQPGKAGGRFSGLRGKFSESDLAGHIADGVERLADDMGRDHAIKVIDHLEGLQKSGLMSLNDIAETLSNPSAQVPAAPEAPRSTAKKVERVVGLNDIPSGTALSRDILTKEGDPLISGGIGLTNMVRAILTHLHDLDLLELPKADDGPGAYVQIAEDFAAGAGAGKPAYTGPVTRVHVHDLKEGDLLARHIYTEDGRMYMQAGSELSSRLISLLKDLGELETISPEVWIQSRSKAPCPP